MKETLRERLNKALAILERLQEGRPALFQQDGGAMLIAIVLDRPLEEAQALVDQPLQFLQEIKQVLDDRKTHPILEQMLRTIQGDAMREALVAPVARDASTTWMMTNSSRQDTSGRPFLPHPPSSYPIRKAHRVTPGQTIVTPGFKSPRHSGSDASCFEVVANFESRP